MKYAKPWLSTDQQLDQLEARGLLVLDRGKALDYGCCRWLGCQLVKLRFWSAQEKTPKQLCCRSSAVERGRVSLNYTYKSKMYSTQRTIVAEIEAEQAPVAANREFIRRFEAKIKTTIDRDWSAT